MEGAEDTVHLQLVQEGGEQEQPSAKRPKREKKETKPPAPRPDHFLALQVSHHPEVCATISQVHAALCQHAPHLRRACVEPAAAHLTLGVLRLDSPEERGRAAEVLSALAAPLAQAALLAPVEVQLEGLSHFRKQVLYLDVRRDDGLERLMALAAATRSHFQAAGLLLEADRPFVPHVTVAKTSKLQGKGPRGKRGSSGSGAGASWGRGRGRGKRGAGQRQGRGHQVGEEGAEEEAVEEAVTPSGAVASGAPSAAADLPGSPPAATAAAPDLPSELAQGGGNSDCCEAAAAATAGALPEAAVPGGASAARTPQQRPEAGVPDQQGDAQQAQRAQQGQLSWRDIPADAWAPHAGIVGGRAVLAEVQLCAMQGRKPGGYYTVLCSLPLAQESLVDSQDGGGSGSLGEERCMAQTERAAEVEAAQPTQNNG